MISREFLSRNALFIAAVISLAFFLALFFFFPGIMTAEYFARLLEQYGLAGIFVGSLVSNATILFPVPFAIVVFGIGLASTSIWYGAQVALAAGIGSAIGEMTSYFMGYLGRKGIESPKHSPY